MENNFIDINEQSINYLHKINNLDTELDDLIDNNSNIVEEKLQQFNELKQEIRLFIININSMIKELKDKDIDQSNDEKDFLDTICSLERYF